MFMHMHISPMDNTPPLAKFKRVDSHTFSRPKSRLMTLDNHTTSLYAIKKKLASSSCGI